MLLDTSVALERLRPELEGSEGGQGKGLALDAVDDIGRQLVAGLDAQHRAWIT